MEKLSLSSITNPSERTLLTFLRSLDQAFCSLTYSYVGYMEPGTLFSEKEQTEDPQRLMFLKVLDYCRPGTWCSGELLLSHVLDGFEEFLEDVDCVLSNRDDPLELPGEVTVSSKAVLYLGMLEFQKELGFITLCEHGTFTALVDPEEMRTAVKLHVKELISTWRLIPVLRHHIDDIQPLVVD